ncbi:hypothetical protein ACJU26_09090 [Acidithiobacillus sp. M4-SHS-6]|uniref:hypothetical protein n=1 Tax=Acidithiobacillus sp. M4-SHS-6 TaxID=3383024 RepID=UPI0039BDABB3
MVYSLAYVWVLVLFVLWRMWGEMLSRISVLDVAGYWFRTIHPQSSTEQQNPGDMPANFRYALVVEYLRSVYGSGLARPWLNRLLFVLGVLGVISAGFVLIYSILYSG